jgi:hypothetical protein
MQKKVIFFLQNKGGCGKSILYYLIAEKYLHVQLLDMDGTTKTTSIQLRYRNPRVIPFENVGKMIDRGMIDFFFEKLSAGKSSVYLGDMGASISQQMPIYFQEVIDELPSSLKELGIELEIYCVVAGSNLFVPCMEYLMELQEAVGGQIPIKVFKNLYFPFLEEQSLSLEQFCTDFSLMLIPFNISESNVPARHERIMEVLKKGDGVKAAPVMIRQYFLKAINALPDLLSIKS